MKEQYVLLTGSKNNAGDYLIKFRAKQLFANIRKDRELVDYNGWEGLNDSKLKIINSSKALILMGGPSLQPGMGSRIYKLPINLDDIQVPILTMGVGWKSIEGSWKSTYNYHLDNRTLELLTRINNEGYLSSLRDYHSLNALRFKGFKKFIMTGCPAYYDLSFVNHNRNQLGLPKKVAFSLGVSFLESKRMANLMKDNILKLKNKFRDEYFEVVFHHSLNNGKFTTAYRNGATHLHKHLEFSDWLSSHDIPYVDISGSAENLINYYEGVDLHIGYRVHAHIFMSSISKFSILLAEDGRAKGTKEVIGGIVLDGYHNYKNSGFSKSIKKLYRGYDRYVANGNVTNEVIANIDYEILSNYHRIRLTREAIDSNFLLMKDYLEQLP